MAPSATLARRARTDIMYHNSWLTTAVHGCYVRHLSHPLLEQRLLLLLKLCKLHETQMTIMVCHSSRSMKLYMVEQLRSTRGIPSQGADICCTRWILQAVHSRHYMPMALSWQREHVELESQWKPPISAAKLGLVEPQDTSLLAATTAQME